MHCVVTGAAGFVGSHLCERLVREGHDVSGIDCFIPYYPREVKEANLAWLRRQPRFRFYELDLRTADLTDLVRDADVIFHEAAMAGLPKSWSNFDLYLTCNVQATQRLVEAMRLHSKARLIYASTSSIYGRESGGRMVYNAAKAAQISLTKAMARELGGQGIRVNTVAPGSILFPGGGWERRLQADPEGMARFVQQEMPYGRFGRPEEVASVVVFLASERASLVNGACIPVDGAQGRSNI